MPSEVSGGLGGQSLNAGGVAVLAENMAVQRVAALVVSLRERRAAVLQDTKCKQAIHTYIKLAHITHQYSYTERQNTQRLP